MSPPELSPEMEACLAGLEAAGLIAWNGEMRGGMPAYIMTEWSKKLKHNHPALFDELVEACVDHDELRRVCERHKKILSRYRQ
jgi:hypothetical protein